MRTPSQAIVEAVLGRLQSGSLDIQTPDGRDVRFEGAAPGPAARVVIRNPNAFRRIAASGSIGLAEGYMAGEWDTDDLRSVLELGTSNLCDPHKGRDIPQPLAPVQRLIHRMRPNSPYGARKNVRYHYDLGNDFFALWLDETLTYSAACFDSLPSQNLRAAQIRKWDRVLELLDPGPADHLLEIGCGWGGFAVHAARETGCRVTGISLSRAQTAIARERVACAGLEELVDVRVQDYRDIEGRYDAIASIEMFEAVGERYWTKFFETVGRALRPGARAALQVITIAEERFETYRRRADFIQKYIFRGGMLPSPSAFETAAKACGLMPGRPRFFGKDYERTLEVWTDRFERAVADVRALGFDERFIRMWRYYLAYCRAGFKAGTTDVMQVPLERSA